MDKTAKVALKEKIELTIIKMEKHVEGLVDVTKPISPENSLGRITRMDAINNKSVAEAALRSARRKLTKLKKALEMIDGSNFGKCHNCGDSIAPQRLMFMPESTSCVRCAG